MSLGIRTGGLTTQSFGWLAKKHHLTESEVRDLDKRYKQADLDRSGQLDKEELKILLKATVASAASEAGLTKFLDSQWHNVDRDGNGTVDFDEFLNLYGVLKATGPNGQQATKASTKPAAGAATTGAAAGKGAEATTTASKGAAAGAKGGKASKAGLGVKRREKKQKTKSTKKVVRRQKTFTPKGKLAEQNYVTNEVAWSVIRNNNAFLVKREGVTLSGEKGNLRNVHSRYHSGLVSHRSVDLSSVDGGVSLRLAAPSARRRNQPARQYTNTKFVSDNRGVARQLKKQLKTYRSSQTNAALARMSRLKASAPGLKRTSKVRGANRRAASSSNNSTAASTTAAATTQTSAN